MELQRKDLGNQASEQAAYEGGADAEYLNTSDVPQGRPEVEVDAVLEGDVYLTPKVSPDFNMALARIEESPLDQLSHALLEEPDESNLELRRVNGVEVQARGHRFDEISKRSPREQLVWYGCSEGMYGAVLGDRIDVLKDVLESSYSCKACKGKGLTESVCGNCLGLKYEGDPPVPCRACKVLGFGMEVPHSSGFKKCDSCSGSGWRGGVIVPEQAQQEAVTGIVVSIGPDCRLLKIGDRVLHSKYAGHTLKIGENNQIVTMRESEVLKILRQR